MPWPVTINGKTYQASDFAPFGYATNFPNILQDVSDVAARVTALIQQAGLDQGQGVAGSLANRLRGDAAGNYTPAQIAQFLANLGLNTFGPPAVNALDNAEMRVAVRGTTFANVSAGASSLQMTLDRWYALRGSGAAGMNVSRVAGPANHAYALRMQRAQGDTALNNLEVGQAIESADFARFAGRTVTVSATLRSGADFSASGGVATLILATGTGADEGRGGAVGGWSGFASTQAAVAATVAGNRVQATFAVPANATEGAVRILYVPTGTAGANDWLDVTGVQIEGGTIAGPFQRVPAALDVLRCRRHARLAPPSSGSWAAQTNTIFSFAAGWGDDMRTNSTVSILSIGNGVSDPYIADYAITGIRYVETTPWAAWIILNTAAATAGRAGVLHPNVQILLSSDL